MNFVTMLLHTKNVHLLKDVGMIPYMLWKQYGYNARIITYKNEEKYEYLEKEVRGLKLKFIPKGRLGKIVDGSIYLWKNAGKIDILNVYHLNLASFIWLHVYKWRKKRGGRAYLKLDMDLKGMERAKKPGLVGFVKRKTIRLSDIVSVESTIIQKELAPFLKKDILYLPNGFNLPKNSGQPFKKETIILTVGNLGTWAKATDVLLHGFALSYKNHGWKLRLIGPVEPSFVKTIEKFFKQWPECRDRVEFLGEIKEKEQLMEEYKKAKIFVLGSRGESFGIALAEAISCGCYLVTTDSVPAGYDLNGKGRFGEVVKTDDAKSMGMVFTKLWKEERDWDAKAEEIMKFAWEHFSWEPAIEKLDKALHIFYDSKHNKKGLFG